MSEHAARWRAVAEQVAPHLHLEGQRSVVCIAGESGAGKTTLARALAPLLPASVVIHQDDFFIRPPLENARHRRASDLAAVGPGEVALDALAAQARTFLAGAAALSVPALDREADVFVRRSLEVSSAEVLVIEGTYVLMLDVDCVRVFIDRTYLQTQAGRRARNRDPEDGHTEAILEIEHRLIAPQVRLADVVVDDDMRVHAPKSEGP